MFFFISELVVVVEAAGDADVCSGRLDDRFWCLLPTTHDVVKKKPPASAHSEEEEESLQLHKGCPPGIRTHYFKLIYRESTQQHWCRTLVVRYFIIIITSYIHFQEIKNGFSLYFALLQFTAIWDLQLQLKV